MIYFDDDDDDPGCVLVSGTEIDQRGANKGDNDNSLAHLLVPVPT